MDIAQMCAHEAETARVVRAIGFMEKPAIAAVSGFALGGGVGPRGRLRLDRHPSRMPLAHAGGAERVAAAVGTGVAACADRTGCGPAAGVGERADHGSRSLPSELADYLVPLYDVEGEAIALAERLAALPRVAVASTKRFFTPLINGNAEASDMLANRIFAENCQDDASKATLRKFGMKV